jgi:hypothetical protein
LPYHAAVAIESITIEPILSTWGTLHRGVASHDVPEADRWLRQATRRELGLPGDRPILATGHQPTLWHPGILAKYIAIDATLRSRRGQDEGLVAANVVVDQDVVDCAALDVPVRRSDGSLASRRIDLAPGVQGKDVPVGRQPTFTPGEIAVEPLENLPGLPRALTEIRLALSSQAHEDNAAGQVSAALSDLMLRHAGIAPMARIMASALMKTTLARDLMAAMASDPRRCAQAYNRAVAAFPRAGLASLAIRDDYVELPIWRVLASGSRIRGYDADVEAWLEQPGEQRDFRSGVVLLPRALLMTAILRAAVVDAFVHGLGGMTYDRAMEMWIAQWRPAPLAAMAMASATMRLPLMPADDLAALRDGALERAQLRERLLLHDPESAGGATARPGPGKRSSLRVIEATPRRSLERRRAFGEMHERLAEVRLQHSAAMSAAGAEVQRMRRLREDLKTASRRDWAFPLYPATLLNELVERIRSSAGQ